MYGIIFGAVAITAGVFGLHFGASGVFAHGDVQRKRVAWPVHVALLIGGGMLLAVGLGLVFVP